MSAFFVALKQGVRILIGPGKATAGRFPATKERTGAGAVNQTCILSGDPETRHSESPGRGDWGKRTGKS